MLAASKSTFVQFFAKDPSPFGLGPPPGAWAQGEFSWTAAGVLLAWTLASYVFGRWQFERGLNFDYGAAASKGTFRPQGQQARVVLSTTECAASRSSLALSSRRNCEFLSRSARFRLVFMMGFSFGF